MSRQGSSLLVALRWWQVASHQQRAVQMILVLPLVALRQWQQVPVQHHRVPLLIHLRGPVLQARSDTDG